MESIALKLFLCVSNWYCVTCFPERLIICLILPKEIDENS